MTTPCEHCGGTTMVRNCIRCGAPLCCDTCCRIETARMIQEEGAASKLAPGWEDLLRCMSEPIPQTKGEKP